MHLTPKPFIATLPEPRERLLDSDVRKAIKAAMNDPVCSEEDCVFVEE